MNKLLFFIGGVVVGFAGSFLYNNRYLEKRYSQIHDKEMDEMEEWYDERIKNLKEDKERLQKVNSMLKEALRVVGQDPDSYNGIVDQHEEGQKDNDAVDLEMVDIKEKLLYNHEKTSNYGGYYKRNSERTETDVEEEFDSDIPMEDDDDEPMTESLEELATRNHNENKHRKPIIISHEDIESLYSNEPNFEIDTLLYYPEDDVLMTEEEEVLDHENFVGDCLMKYGFATSDEDVIYVKNFALDMVFEVVKMED